MLEHPSIRRYSPLFIDVGGSDNPTGADNQQETARDPQRLHARHHREQRQPRTGEGTVRSSWRHEESGRNDLATFIHMDARSNNMPKVAKFLVG